MEKYNEEKEEKSIKIGRRFGFILASEAKSCKIRQRNVLSFGDKSLCQNPALKDTPWGGCILSTEVCMISFHSDVIGYDRMWMDIHSPLFTSVYLSIGILCAF